MHIGDRTGLELLRTLQDKAVHSGIDVYMEYIVTRLLKAGDCVAGAFGYRRIDGGYHLWSAKAVVLATGGAGKAWRVNSNSWETTGDGHALGYDAGAELVDMEFVQFHPTGMVWPPGVIGLLVTEAVRGEGGILRNNQGERFMERYDPKRLELSTRDVVARAIYTEVREGRGSPHGGVFLDVSHLSDDHVKRKLPAMYAQFLELAGVDITKEPMEVGPTCHYFMGGVSVDPETGATTVPGLFGAGECTGGMNGANRLGGNSLSDLLVFGLRAGEAAAAEAAQAAAPTLADEEVAAAAEEMDAFLDGPGRGPLRHPARPSADDARSRRDLPGRREPHGGAREARGAEAARYGAGARAPLPGRAWNPGWNLCRDLQNMLTVAEAVARAGLLREESRGAHSRIDFPEYDERWGGLNIVVRKGREGMELEPRPVRMRDELAGLVDRRKAAETGGRRGGRR